MIENFLPANCYSKNRMKSVDGAVIHYISATNIKPNNPFDLDAILNIFKEYKVSAHYLIRRDGSIIELIPEGYKAYHAGYSIMNDEEDCNSYTLGIELEGGAAWPFEDAQMFSLAELLGQQMTKHQFTLDWVQGHDTVRANWLERHPEKAEKKNVGKKYDPGAHFQWEILNDMLYGVSAAIEPSYVYNK